MASLTQSPSGRQRNTTLPFPSEIRNEIYKYVLTNPSQLPIKRTKVRSENRWIESGGEPDPASLQLLAASRQTYMEAHSIYYCENTLHFPNFSSFYRFATNTGPERRQCITSLSFNYGRDDDLPWYKFPIWMFPHLISLEVHYLPFPSFPDLPLVEFFVDVRGLETACFIERLDYRPAEEFCLTHNHPCRDNAPPPRVYVRELERFMTASEVERPHSRTIFEPPYNLVPPNNLVPGSWPVPGTVDRNERHGSRIMRLQARKGEKGENEVYAAFDSRKPHAQVYSLSMIKMKVWNY